MHKHTTVLTGYQHLPGYSRAECDYKVHFVSPLAWQMHLLCKSWWIFSLNSKSKAHLTSVSQCEGPSRMSAKATKGKKHALGFVVCWGIVLIGSNSWWILRMYDFFVLVCIWVSYAVENHPTWLTILILILKAVVLYQCKIRTIKSVKGLMFSFKI